jgi:signal transduction histidine kinase
MLVKVKICGVWEPGNTCDTRSFFIAFASAIGQPALALLALNQNRLCAVIGAGQFFILIAIFYFHQSYTPSSFYRDAVYCECQTNLSGYSVLISTDIVFHIIILIIDGFLERRDRQMFELREQLKTQFMATQRAQQAEKQAADLKKRFASYSELSDCVSDRTPVAEISLVFHEVRVPLNTATLAVQNLQGDGVFDHIPEDQKEMVHGLAGSLQLMEKVRLDRDISEVRTDIDCRFSTMFSLSIEWSPVNSRKPKCLSTSTSPSNLPPCHIPPLPNRRASL